MRDLVRIGTGAKLAAMVLLIGVTTTVAVAFTTQSLVQGAIVREASSRLTILGGIVAGGLREHYEQLTSRLTELADAPTLINRLDEDRSSASGALSTFLRRIQSEDAHTSVLVLDNMGRVVQSTGAFDDRDALDALARGVGRSGGRPVLVQTGRSILPNLAGVGLGGAYDRSAGMLVIELSTAALEGLVTCAP